jgi:hypothetical protein
MANRRFIDFPIAASVGDNDIVLIWQEGLNKQTTKATLFQGSPNSLAGLTDVDISALANGQILQYNSTTSKWENVDRTDIDLDQLGDVTIVSPTNGQVLVYNSSTSKWENSSGGFVPYTGAVTTVNLGAQSILAGSFVKAGGTAAQFLKANGSIDSTAYGTGSVTSVALTMPSAFSVANSPITTAGTLAVTGAGTVAQYVRGDGSLATFPALTGFVPYTGATADVNLGTHDLTAERGTFQNNGSSDTLTVNHTSGSGYGIIVTKGGANEALYVSKTSGSGNAMTVVGGRTSLVDLALSSVTNTAGDFLTISGGVVHKRTAAEVRTDIGAGTVTSVAALTLGTSGTDLSSTVANGTTTPVITLNVPTASSTNRGALSSADWSLFNGKQAQLNGTGFVKASGTTISYDNTSYLPLTGGTLTGPLGGTSASFLEALTVNGQVTFYQPLTNTSSYLIVENNRSRNAAIRLKTTLGDYYLGTGIGADTNQFQIFDGNAGENRLTITSTGAATFSSSVTANSFIKSGGNSSEFLKADGSVDSTTYVPVGRTITINGTTQDLSANRTFNVGTVTSVTASSPLASSGGATPNITIQQSSGSQNGFLSSTDWTTFNNKQNSLTNPVTGTGASGQIAYFNGTTSITSESNLFWDATNDRLGIGTNTPASTLDVNGIGRFTGSVTADFIVVGTTAATSGGIRLGTQVAIRARNVANTANIPLIESTASDGVSIASGGANVGIGTTSDAGFKLQVNGEGRFYQSLTNSSAYLRVENNRSRNAALRLTTTVGDYYLGVGIGADVNQFQIFDGNAGETRLTIASTGAATFRASFALPHTTKSSNYTLDASDYTVGFDCASNRTANLPDATTCAGRIYVIYQYNTNTGMRYVTIDPNGSQTISGVATYPLSSYGDFSSVMIQSTGSNWVVISDALYFIPV